MSGRTSLTWSRSRTSGVRWPRRRVYREREATCWKLRPTRTSTATRTCHSSSTTWSSETAVKRLSLTSMGWAASQSKNRQCWPGQNLRSSLARRLRPPHLHLQVPLLNLKLFRIRKSCLRWEAAKMRKTFPTRPSRLKRAALSSPRCHLPTRTTWITTMQTATTTTIKTSKFWRKSRRKIFGMKVMASKFANPIGNGGWNMLS